MVRKVNAMRLGDFESPACLVSSIKINFNFGLHTPAKLN
jgi:hypothetical protein